MNKEVCADKYESAYSFYMEVYLEKRIISETRNLLSCSVSYVISVEMDI